MVTYDCMKIKPTIQEYGKHEYRKLTIIWSRVLVACFYVLKPCMIPDAPYIRTKYGSNYGNPVDQYFPFGFLCIQTVAARSILPYFQTTESCFLDIRINHWKPVLPSEKFGEILSMSKREKQKCEKNFGISSTEETKNPAGLHEVWKYGISWP